MNTTTLNIKTPGAYADHNITLDMGDVILLSKASMHTAEIAQEPLLLLPQSVMLAKGFLGPIDIPIMKRNVLSEREVREFMKLSSAVKQPPWEMMQAHEWVESWMAANLGDVAERKLWPNTFWLEGRVDQLATVIGMDFLWGNMVADPSKYITLTVHRAGPGRKVKPAMVRTAKRPASHIARQEGNKDDGNLADSEANDRGEDMGAGNKSGKNKGGKLATKKNTAQAKKRIRTTQAASSASVSQVAGASGCSKCRWSANGCAKCKARAGLI